MSRPALMQWVAELISPRHPSVDPPRRVGLKRKRVIDLTDEPNEHRNKRSRMSDEPQHLDEWDSSSWSFSSFWSLFTSPSPQRSRALPRPVHVVADDSDEEYGPLYSASSVMFPPTMKDYVHTSMSSSLDRFTKLDSLRRERRKLALYKSFGVEEPESEREVIAIPDSDDRFPLPPSLSSGSGHGEELHCPTPTHAQQLQSGKKFFMPESLANCFPHVRRKLRATRRSASPKGVKSPHGTNRSSIRSSSRSKRSTSFLEGTAMLKFDDLDLVQDSASQYGDGVADRLALLHRYRKEATFKGGKRKDTVMLGSRVWAPSSLDDLREKAKQKNAEMQQRAAELRRRKELEKLRREQEEDRKNRYRPLTLDEKRIYQHTVYERAPNDVIVTKNRVDLLQKDVVHFDGCEWLNDECINTYIFMLLERRQNAPNPEKYAKCHFLNSFWYPLLKKGYQRIRRWTAKVDVFSFDYVLIPINLNNTHWALAAINFVKKRLEYYDAMGGGGRACQELLRQFLRDEMKDKKGVEESFDEWENYSPGRKVPQQANGYDCGVFVCRFAEVLSRHVQSHDEGEPYFDFSQKEIPMLRKRMVAEIASGHIGP